MDSFELVFYLLFCAVLALAVLVRIAAVRTWGLRLGLRALERLTPEPEIDQDALDLYEALRRERLLRDVARLRRVVAHDEHMSAVRQIGNRMAYDRLLHDLSELRDAPPLAWEADRAATWASSDALGSIAPPRAAARDLQHRPKVETLELGWRR